MSDSPEPSAATRESGAAVRVPAPPLLFAAPLSATLALAEVAAVAFARAAGDEDRRRGPHYCRTCAQRVRRSDLPA